MGKNKSVLERLYEKALNRANETGEMAVMKFGDLTVTAYPTNKVMQQDDTPPDFKWYFVSDRLPYVENYGISKDVLVAFETEDGAIGFGIGFLYGKEYGYDEDERWYVRTTKLSANVERVIAWIPIHCLKEDVYRCCKQ